MRGTPELLFVTLPFAHHIIIKILICQNSCIMAFGRQALQAVLQTGLINFGSPALLTRLWGQHSTQLMGLRACPLEK